MNMNKIGFGLMLATVAGSAFAYAPNAAHDIVVRIGGASAQDANLESMIYNDVCVADTNRDRYSFAGANTSYRGISCTVKTGVTGLTAGKKLQIIKRSAGGSGYGVQPVVFSTAIDFMKVSSGCTAGSAVAGYTYDCTQTELVVPDAGVSDVDPLMFTGQNIPAGFTKGVTSTSGLTVKPVAALSFGVAISKDLRDVLQDQMIVANLMSNTCDDTAAARDTEACMPSFTKHQVASILSGQVYDWSQLTINGNDIWTAAGASQPTDSAIKICRRENGSGTQATANATFLGYPCGSAGITPASGPNGPNGNPIVENAAAGNLDTCLVSDTPVAPATGPANWKFGFQSTERNPTGSLNFRFVKVDGVAPTIENVANGKHIFWSEATMQWKNNASADVKSVMGVISTDISNVTRTAARNASFVHPWGGAGYLALASNGPVPDAIWNSANPVTGFQHNLNGDLNNCRVPSTSQIALPFGK